MGVEPFLVASSVNLVLAQRLIRVVCTACKEPIEIPPQALIDIGVRPEDVGKFTPFRGTGCSQCGGSGFRGRSALYELMPISDELRDLILSGASERDIKRTAISVGMSTLRMSGLALLKQGVTTVDEVVRVTMAD
jgi:type IV pilus assembly protein PilB